MATEERPKSEIEELGDKIAALTVREAVQLARYVQRKTSGGIALGLSPYLEAFRDSVAPAATINSEWHLMGLTSDRHFVVGFSEVARNANVIYFNIEGIRNIAEAIQYGKRAPDTEIAGLGTNYTNYELTRLSMWAAFGDGIQSPEQYAKIRWYNCTDVIAEPAAFSAAWN